MEIHVYVKRDGVVIVRDLAWGNTARAAKAAADALMRSYALDYPDAAIFQVREPAR